MDQQELLQKALSLSYFFLKFRPRTKREVRDYLCKKQAQQGFTDDIIDEAIVRLEEQKFVNDADFVEWYVASRSRAKPKSRFALEQELSRLGIEKDVLQEFFNGQELPEADLAVSALGAKWNQWHGLEPRDRFQKAAAFLMRRGFSYDIIKKAVAKYEGTE